MCKVQMLRALVKQRLTAAAEEIFGLFERTIAEYEEELRRSKEENERQRELLAAVFQPQLRLHRAVCPADVQQLSLSKEEVPPEQQDWNPSLDQDPEPPHIKEEQEELWTGQEGEQLRGLEEADITEFPFAPVPVKSEEDEEKPQSSQLHQSQTEQMETGADGEDCGGPGPARNSDPDTYLQPETDDKTGDSSGTDDSDGDWEETRDPQSGLNSQKDNEVPVSDINCKTVERSFSCSESVQRFGRKPHLNAHMRIHTGEKPFSCSFCGKRFSQKGNSISHMRLHTGEKPFSCSVCKKRFRYSGDVSRHMRIHTGKKTLHHNVGDMINSNIHTGPEPALDPGSHLEPDIDDGWKKTRKPQSGLKSLKNNKVTVSESRCKTGEKPFSCSECGKRFSKKGNLKIHMRIHTGEKPFGCSVCGQRFSQKGHLIQHMTLHTGEKPFGCSVCNKRFICQSRLKKHKCVHRQSSQLHQDGLAEKPFSCSFCGKKFKRKQYLVKHIMIHTGDKPFTCSVCNTSFTRKAILVHHMRIHTGEKPFSCSVCGQRFVHHGQMTVHMVGHTGEKRISCSGCDRRFIWPYQLQRHKCVGEKS